MNWSLPDKYKWESVFEVMDLQDVDFLVLVTDAAVESRLSHHAFITL